MVKPKPKIVLIHSETRSYRVPLFTELSKRYDITFLFMEGKRRSTTFPESRQWKYKDLRPYPMWGYSSDFSPGLIRELIRRRKTYDYIISSSLGDFATHVAFPLSKLLRKKFILWSEDWRWSRHALAAVAFPYVKRIARGSHACIAAGTKTKEFFLQLGVKPDRIFVAPNCAPDVTPLIDVTHLTTLRDTINPQHRTVISYIGRIVSYKALDTLIHAFHQLEQTHHDILLLIVGDGPFAPECARLIETLGASHIYWPQMAHLSAGREQEIIPHRELLHYLALTDIFVLPGRFRMYDHVVSESWGFILNEALSLGKPIISTTSVAAAYDLIAQGENGYRVRENDPSALIEAMGRMLNDPVARATMGLRSRWMFEEKFKYPNMLQGFQAAIESSITT